MQRNFVSSIRALTGTHLKRLFRDKAAIFFTFLFPLMFLLVFGSLNRNNGSARFDIAIINRADSSFATQFVEKIKASDSFRINDAITTLDQARDKMGGGELDSVLELPETFGDPNTQGIPNGVLTVYYEESSPQGGQTVAAVMKGIFEELNRELTQQIPPLTVVQKSTATNNLTSFDYVFSGLLGFSMLSLGVFGMANSFPAHKKTGSFRRLRVAPITPTHLIVSNAITYLLIGILSIIIMVVTGIVVFDFQMQGEWGSFAIITILGILMMFGFGLAIGGWSQNENQSAPLSNLVSFPLMFLSGVFFPRFLMPEWLQGITAYLPLSPIVDGLRAIIAEGKTVFELGPEIGLIALWMVAIYALAIKVFRWE